MLCVYVVLCIWVMGFRKKFIFSEGLWCCLILYFEVVSVDLCIYTCGKFSGLLFCIVVVVFPDVLMFHFLGFRVILLLCLSFKFHGRRVKMYFCL